MTQTATAPPQTPERRKQARADVTRQRLLDAAVELMHRDGLARTTTHDVARLAGVSRGALTHHFESREELIAAAVRHMLASAVSDLKAFAVAFAERDGSSDEIIEFLWRIMRDRLFVVTLEFLPEARHNAVFRARILPVVQEWHAALDHVWTLLAARYSVTPAFARAAMNAAMCMIRGMIAQTVVRDDPRYFKSLLDLCKSTVRAQLASAPRVAPSASRRSPPRRRATA